MPSTELGRNVQGEMLTHGIDTEPELTDFVTTARESGQMKESLARVSGQRNNRYISRRRMRHDARRVLREGTQCGAIDWLGFNNMPVTFGGGAPGFSGTFIIGGVSVDQDKRATEWWSDLFLFQSRAGGPLFGFGGAFGGWAADASWLNELSAELFKTGAVVPGGGLSPKIISLSDGSVDAGTLRVRAGCSWDGKKIENVAGEDDLVIHESGSAPTGAEEGMWTSFRDAQNQCWTVPKWLEYDAHDAFYLSYRYSVDLTDHGVPVGGLIDAVCFANIIKGDKSVGGSYGFIIEEGDGTDAVLITGDEDPDVIALSKTDPDPSIVFSLHDLIA